MLASISYTYQYLVRLLVARAFASLPQNLRKMEWDLQMIFYQSVRAFSLDSTLITGGNA